MFNQFLVILCISSYFKVISSDVKFIATTRQFNPKFVSNFTTSIEKEPNGLNVDITLIQPIIIDFYAFVDVQIRLRDSKIYQSLFTEEFDVCELVNNVLINNLMKRWYRNLVKYGNFMENCPVPEGYYYLRGLVVEHSSLAMYLRPGDYRISGHGYFKRADLNETVVKATLDVKWSK
ncbi:uncharacterized protein LOC129919746 [Episyrphus balteatus]|uniref:uncharacterized protein LOC129919746 n=1 Tax=Episyrphus balteatus TaxID=286459 RepID=UPI0024854588|nr:uncharacterized protein LOC129919746 [Episyrphus balteatus]